MSSLQQHEFLRKAFFTMKKGEVVWLKIGPKHHKDVYHNSCTKDHISKDAEIGTDIWMKIYIETIKRNPPYKQNLPFEGKVEYYETCRVICKELVQEEEYKNAQDLYARCLAEFKNMAKKVLNNLNEEQKAKRLCVLVILNMNMAYIHLKRQDYIKAAKHSKDAIAIDPNNSKAHYRHYLASKATGGLD